MTTAGIHNIAAWIASRARRLRPPAPASGPLDRELFRWGPRDPFTVRQLLNGGVAVIGRAGSGKTSSSGKLLARAVVGLPGSGGLVLAAKPEDLSDWQRVFAAAGRADDLVVFAPGGPHRFNFLSYVLAVGGDTRDVTKCVTVINETLRAADTKGGENADFFEKQTDRTIYNAVEMVRRGTGGVSAPDLQRFINTAPLARDQIRTPEWRQSFCSRVLQAAHAKPKSAVEAHDFDLATDFWLSEFPAMADKTRSSILAGVLGCLHVFNTGLVRELVSGGTTVTPDDMLKGKWILVDMPPAEYGDTGSLVAAGWKYLTEKMVLRRHAGGADAPVVIWCDEAAQFVNSYDSEFITQCRSHRGCLVYLTQSLSSYYGALKGDAGRNQADSLLTNFSTRIFHAVGDATTAAWASGMVGQELEAVVTVSQLPGENPFAELFEPARSSSSAALQYLPGLQPKVLMHGLRTGGEANGLICDAIVIRSAEPFSDGRSWMKVSFTQRD